MLNIPFVPFADLSILTGDDLILTRNKRQSRFLLAHWPSLQQANILPNPPQFLPLQTWLQQLWADIGTHACIHQDALLALTSQTVAELNDQPHLNTEALTKNTIQAWGLLQQWQLPISSLADYPFHQPTQFLQQALHNLTDMLAERELITADAIMTNLCQLCASQPTQVQAALPNTLYWYGFIDQTPALAAWIEQLSPLCKLQQLRTPTFAATPTATAFADPQAEFTAMADWALQQHEQNPAQSIVCIVPNIEQHKTDILAALLKTHPHADSLVNFSSGQTLNQTPLWQSALNFLQLKHYKTNYEQLTLCLKSHFWGDNHLEHTILKDRFINEILRHCQPSQSLAQFIQPVTKQEDLQPLVAPLLAWLTVRSNKPKGKQSLQQWLTYFCRELQALGWPGSEPLTSTYYQQYEHIQQLWLRFIDLDQTLPPCDYQQALTLLYQLSKSTLFSPESKSRPIQILGPLESHGLLADKCWMCQLTEEQWPPVGKLNPLLPTMLQQKYKMPHACYEKTTAYFKQLTEDLWHAAPATQLSFAQFANGVEQTATTLLNPYPIESVHNNAASVPITPAASHTFFTAIEDHHGPALTTTALPGGSYGYQTQAQCPFQFFAHYRLRCQEPALPYLGFDAADRGSLVHEALANVWRELKTSAQLSTLTSTQLDAVIHRAIQAALPANQADAIFTHTEQTRLFLVLQRWLSTEKQRPPFHVKALEKTIYYTNQTLKSTMRFDRIDTLADGSELVIDYKTSKQASTLGWFDERLTNPQLPLYLLTQTTLNGASIALVNRKNPKFLGFSAAATEIIGITTVEDYDAAWQWASLLQHWQQQITQLTLEIKDGFAGVMPDATTNPCQYCDLTLLCRVYHDS